MTMGKSDTLVKKIVLHVLCNTRPLRSSIIPNLQDTSSSVKKEFLVPTHSHGGYEAYTL